MRLDHVAFAVWDLSKAATFWTQVMGGEYRQGHADWRGFAFTQFGFQGGGRVEILAPGTDTSGFVVKDTAWGMPLGKVLENAAVRPDLR